MNLFSGFKKPAWQSSNAHKRLAAVANDVSAELRAALPHLATDDPDPDVRRAALQRSADALLYARAMRSDADTGLRTWARERWLAALADGTLTDSEDADLATLTPGECERLIAVSKQAALRRRLLDRMQRPGLIAERAIADPDPALRLSLVERIDDVAALERVARKARKSDKRLHRRALERAEALRLAAGDDGARQRRAEALCETLERLIRETLTPDARETALLRCQSEWSSLEVDTLPERVKTRYEGACAVIRAQVAPPPDVIPANDGTLPDETAMLSEPATSQPDPEVETTPSTEEIAAHARLQAELAADAERRARERAQAEERRREDERRQAEQDALLQQLDDALDAGDLAQARSHAGTVDPQALSKSGRRRWQSMQPRLQKLDSWERWANNKVRARLCDEIEQLIGSGLHPDALATRIREAQQEWRRLDALEGRTDASAPSGLDKRFRVITARALKPARGFFEKRDALREERQQSIQAFLDAAMPIPDAADLPALLDLQRGATQHLRDLNDLRHADRKPLAKRLRDLLDALRMRLDASFEEIEIARSALIAAAVQLNAETTDGRRLAADAKALMARWKAIGKGRHRRDQEQWREFRGALDRVFAGLDERRQQASTERAERDQQAEALASELETLAGLEGSALTATQSRVRDIRDQWHALSIRDPALSERYDTALTRHRDALRGLDRDRRRESYLALLDAAATSDQTTDSDAQALQQAQALVFEAEALAGIDGPEAERAARRQWQLGRLQQHLRGDKPDSADQAVNQILQRWQTLEGLGSTDRERYRERLTRAIEQWISHE